MLHTWKCLYLPSELIDNLAGWRILGWKSCCFRILRALLCCLLASSVIHWRMKSQIWFLISISLFLSQRFFKSLCPHVLKFHDDVSWWVSFHPFFWAFEGPLNLETHVLELGKCFCIVLLMTASPKSSLFSLSGTLLFRYWNSQTYCFNLLIFSLLFSISSSSSGFPQVYLPTLLSHFLGLLSCFNF